MNNFKHTPGPWKVRYQRDDPEAHDFFVQGPKTDPNMAYDIEIMGDDYGDQTGYPREQKVADAHLIAIAPKMYDALVKLSYLGNGNVLGNSDGNMIARRVLQLLDVSGDKK